jgi:hypothetical protein
MKDTKESMLKVYNYVILVAGGIALLAFSLLVGTIYSVNRSKIYPVADTTGKVYIEELRGLVIHYVHEDFENNLADSSIKKIDLLKKLDNSISKGFDEAGHRHISPDSQTGLIAVWTSLLIFSLAVVFWFFNKRERFELNYHMEQSQIRRLEKENLGTYNEKLKILLDALEREGKIKKDYLSEMPPQMK